MAKAIVHVGVGKTGSSSLQTFFSHEGNDILAAAGFVYGAVSGDGGILHGEKLSRIARRTPLGHLSSTPTILQTANRERLRSDIAALSSQGLTPVFSQESWHRKALLFQDDAIFETLDCVVDIVAYVRPQVEWFNAAWWEWFAWDKLFSCPGDVVAKRGLNMMRWGTLLARWKTVPRVSSVIVRLHPEDVVSDFLSVLGIPAADKAAQATRCNTGVSPTQLELYRAAPGLRGIHGADMDHILSGFLHDTNPPPWVIERELASDIITRLGDDNHVLLEMLGDSQKTIMLDDQRWWSAEAYAQRFAESPVDTQFTREQCLELITRLARELLDEKNGRAVPTVP